MALWQPPISLQFFSTVTFYFHFVVNSIFTFISISISIETVKFTNTISCRSRLVSFDTHRSTPINTVFSSPVWRDRSVGPLPPFLVFILKILRKNRNWYLLIFLISLHISRSPLKFLSSIPLYSSLSFKTYELWFFYVFVLNLCHLCILKCDCVTRNSRGARHAVQMVALTFGKQLNVLRRTALQAVPSWHLVIDASFTVAFR